MGIFKRKNNTETVGKTPAWKLGLLIYMTVWVVCVLWFWLQLVVNKFSANSWFDTYNLIAFWLILPVVAFVTSFSLERKQGLGLWRVVAVMFFGVMYLVAVYATFTLATFFKILNIGSPAWYELLGGSIPSAVGIVAGCAMRNRKNQTDAK